MSSGGDPIALATDASGQVMLNGADLRSPNGSTIAANSITSLNVTGSPADDVIDMSGVTLAAFVSLNQLSVNGEAGDDLIISSPFVANLTGQSSTGSITTNSPPTSPSSLMSADVNQGFDLVVAALSSSSNVAMTSRGTNSTSVISSSNLSPSPAALVTDRADIGSKVTAEEHLASHFLWQKETVPLRSSIATANPGLTGTPAASLIASVSDKGLAVLGRTPPELQTTKSSAHGTEDGLIDISTDYPLNTTRRPKLDLSISKPTDQAEDSGLVATRIAVTSPQLRLSPHLPAREVPAIFKNPDDGGFIELSVESAGKNLAKRSGPGSVKGFCRHDQLDVEIGRWVAFGDAEFLDQVLARTSPKKVSTEATTEPAPERTVASRRMTWGLALAAGAAAILLPQRFNRRIAAVLKSRLQKVKRGLQSLVTQCK